MPPCYAICQQTIIQRAVLLNCQHGAEYRQGRFEDRCFRPTEHDEASAETSHEETRGHHTCTESTKEREPCFVFRQVTGCVHSANEIGSKPAQVIRYNARYKGNLVLKGLITAPSAILELESLC